MYALHIVKTWEERCEKLNPFVALIGDAIVGFAEFEQNGHIDCFYVYDKFQSCRVRTALMGEIESREKLLPSSYVEVSITARPFSTEKS